LILMPATAVSSPKRAAKPRSYLFTCKLIETIVLTFKRYVTFVKGNMQMMHVADMTKGRNLLS
ncbi:MAG: hypothetical protein AAFP99_01315, partial [Pseudomonadota bacterium]